jgi:hypothetical protein
MIYNCSMGGVTMSEIDKEYIKENVLTAKEAQDYLGISKQTLYYRIKENIIPVLKEVDSENNIKKERLFWKPDLEAEKKRREERKKQKESRK